MKVFLFTLLSLVSIIALGSIGSSSAETSVNVEEQQTIALIGSGIDPDNDTLSYEWKQTGGHFVELSAYDIAEPTFLAPSVENGQTEILSFSLTVSDFFGGVSEESIQIIVNPINHVPTVDAGRDRLVLPSVNAITIFIDAHDADGDLLSYSWKQLAGQSTQIANMNLKYLTIDSALLNFNDFATMTFEVTVDDGFGGVATDIVDVYIGMFGSEDSSISVNAGPIQVIDEGSQVTLHGEGSEIDDKPIIFSWTQHVGPKVNLSSAVNPSPTFMAPDLDDEQSVVLSFILTGYVPGSGYAQDMAIVKVMPVNHPPTADAGNDQTVRELSRVKLIGTGSDIDGDRVTYSWNQISGPEVISDSLYAELSFVAPDVSTDETVTLGFELSVRDHHGAVTTDSVNVIVDSLNHPPSAFAGLDRSVEGSTDVTLFGSGFDSDNDPLTYSWRQISGPKVDLSVSESTVFFVAPAGIPNRTAVMTFEFLVSDSFGGSDIDFVNVSVLASNSSPTVNAGPDREVDEGTVLTLSCLGNDADGDALSYTWSQISGPNIKISNPNSPTLSFVAPSVVNTTVLEFKCVVTDGVVSSSDTVDVTVYNILTLDIVANAGEDRIINENRSISLDGTASNDPENQPLTYLWSQISGENVSLDNVDAVTPKFTSPSVVNGQIKVLVFELTVSDDNGRVDSDTVTITVDPVNAPPEVKVSARQIS